MTEVSRCRYRVTVRPAVYERAILRDLNNVFCDDLEPCLIMTTKFPPNLKQCDIGFDCGGITLYAAEELDEAQLGYARHPDGTSLVGSEPGGWRETWVVIGHETACGDPIFVDTSDEAFPVFTAMHGVGEWNPDQVAMSYDAFLQIVEHFAEVAAGRENPAALEAKPMTQAEFDAFVAFAAARSGNEDNQFWELLVSDEEAGVGYDM